MATSLQPAGRHAYARVLPSHLRLVAEGQAQQGGAERRLLRRLGPQVLLHRPPLLLHRGRERRAAGSGSRQCDCGVVEHAGFPRGAGGARPLGTRGGQGGPGVCIDG